MKKSEFLTRNHWSLTSTYQLKTGFDFCLRIKASTFIVSYDLLPPFFSIDVFRDKVLSLGFSRSVSLVHGVCVVTRKFETSRPELFMKPARELSGALWRRGGKRKEILQLQYVSGIWIPPVAPRRLSCQISASQLEAETSANVNKHWKTRAKGNDVITNVISANQHFASTIQIPEMSYKLSFLFPPRSKTSPESLLAGYFHASKQTIISSKVTFGLPMVIKSLISRITEKQNKKRQEKDLRRRRRERSANCVLLSRHYL